MTHVATKKKTRSARHIIYTIGHSNHEVEQFLDLLRAHGVQLVVDVRTIPKSRHNPQFTKDALRLSLRRARIGYLHLDALGGLRHAKADSTNRGWRNASFRGFADYMATASFAKGLDELKKIAAQKKTAVMCAEAVPWRCHRSLIADALAKQGWTVLHIQSKTAARKHGVTPFLRMKKGICTYPAAR